MDNKERSIRMFKLQEMGEKEEEEEEKFHSTYLLLSIHYYYFPFCSI